MKLYTTNWCNSCTGIKKAIEELGLDVEIVDVDLLREIPTEVRSVPTLEDDSMFISGGIIILNYLKGCRKYVTVPNT